MITKSTRWYYCASDRSFLSTLYVKLLLSSQKMSQLQGLKVPDFEQQKNERIGEISKEPRTEMLLASEDLYEILSAKITNVGVHQI